MEWKKYKNSNYEVSSAGTVRNFVTGKQLRPVIDSNGYCYITVCPERKKIAIHRMVLTAFVGEKDMHACHNNGVRNDNRLENLRWATAKENCADKIIHGTHQYGERLAQTKLTEAQVLSIKRLLAKGVTQKEIAARHGTTQTHVSDIKRGKCWAWL